MALRKWDIPKENNKLASILAEECSINELAASVLVNRGHATYRDAYKFLDKNGEISSPFDMADMQKAVDRIREAVDGFEKIAVYGDYDCDGITSTAILYTYLSSIGADVVYYIPERDGEGYGLNRDAITRLSADGVTLIITVDTGISAIEETKYASAMGVDMVITDHHQTGNTLPDAVAIVNPHRADCKSSFKELCGAGVCFKLIAALEDGDCMSVLESFGDLIALGTVGDIVPLVGENRALVRYGISMMKMCDNIGLRALMQSAGVKLDLLDATTLSFSLVPRINAAGRMGNASLAVQLLLCEDEKEAVQIAQKLCAMNEARRSEEAEICADIYSMLEADKALSHGRAIVLSGKGWNHGILGIVCSRLVENQAKPVFLMTQDGDMLKGSARGVGEFHIFKALSANADHLTQYGGHKAAGGFCLKADNFEKLKSGIEEYAKKNYAAMPIPAYKVDKVMSAADLTIEAIEGLCELEPFGAGNEQPLFMIANAKINSIIPLSEGKHQKLMLDSDGAELSALMFSVTKNDLIYKSGDIVDILVQAGINSYNGKRSVSLKVKDIRPHAFSQERYFMAKECYEKIMREEEISPNQKAAAVPSRDELSAIYKILLSQNGYDKHIDSFYLQTLKNSKENSINYCKICVCFDVLIELKLCQKTKNGYELIASKQKVDLAGSSLLSRLNTK